MYQKYANSLTNTTAESAFSVDNYILPVPILVQQGT